MGGVPTLTYYDRILAAIAASLGGGALAGVVTPVQFRTGLFVGSLVATAFVYAALFRNPPLPETSTRVKAAAAVWHAVPAGVLLSP
ncbi:hypothetical protein [Halomicrobium urmianum]|uniref:hypothetical protein n=1 Tax=Halomicrobium urmianum TaxID=1586233 RepID=UPI001CD9255D|nr:hypothetical protein [Halomicrobium urmianum]